MSDIDVDTLVETLQNTKCEVTFTKVNGEERVMTCTLSGDLFEYDPKGKENKSAGDSVSVWDLNANGWRAFKKSNVKSWVTVEE